MPSTPKLHACHHRQEIRDGNFCVSVSASDCLINISGGSSSPLLDAKIGGEAALQAASPDGAADPPTNYASIFAIFISPGIRVRHPLHRHECAGLREICPRGCRD